MDVDPDAGQDPEAQPGAAPPAGAASALVAPTGRRQAFRAVRRHLSDDELGSPGVQRLILDDLEQAEAERADFAKYVDRFHEADKRAAVLAERVASLQSLDVMFGVGVGLGGTLLGLVQTVGWVGGGVGVVLVATSVIVRVRR